MKFTDIENNVRAALAEDVGSGDITAALIPEAPIVRATIITRENAIICGCAWVDEVFRQINPNIEVNWNIIDGERVAANAVLCELMGPARGLLTGERTALNFLQTLSGTATNVYHYAEKITGTRAKLLDTRKTLPGLRAAQKYAVRCGGGYNHRMGLYDAYLIKENHIAACGSITAAVRIAKMLHADKPIEVEVENLMQLHEALAQRVDTIMLDNFDLVNMRAAVEINSQQAKLEVSGNVSLENIRAIAETGIDYISVGGLTKNVRAIDLSMRLF